MRCKTGRKASIEYYAMICWISKDSAHVSFSNVQLSSRYHSFAALFELKLAAFIKELWHWEDDISTLWSESIFSHSGISAILDVSKNWKTFWARSDEVQCMPWRSVPIINFIRSWTALNISFLSAFTNLEPFRCISSHQLLSNRAHKIQANRRKQSYQSFCAFGGTLSRSLKVLFGTCKNKKTQRSKL